MKSGEEEEVMDQVEIHVKKDGAELSLKMKRKGKKNNCTSKKDCKNRQFSKVWLSISACNCTHWTVPVLNTVLYWWLKKAIFVIFVLKGLWGYYNIIIFMITSVLFISVQGYVVVAAFCSETFLDKIKHYLKSGES